MADAHASGAAGKPNAAASETNVAVIAIHGVGTHLSGASADAVSTLLMSIGRNDKGGTPQAGSAPPYSGFVTTSIDVPLRPVQSPPQDAEIAKYRVRDEDSWLSRIRGIFDERRGFLAMRRQNASYRPEHDKNRKLRNGEPDRGDFGYQFMLTQVAEYEGEVDRNFATVRLDGKREGHSPATNVHIYDAHYSDLTKPQSSILSFFLAFYQLLIHLASLSLLAVYWAEAENVEADGGRRWRWRFKSAANATSVRLLTMFVPSLNLILLAIAACTFADKVQSDLVLRATSLAFAGFLSAVATFLIARSASSPSRPFLWAIVPMLGAAVGVLILTGFAYLYHFACDPTLSVWKILLLFCWLITSGAILGLIARIFAPVRPGAFFLTILLYVLNLCFFLFYLLPNAAKAAGNGPNQVGLASLWAVQWIFGELSLSWVLCLASALLSWPLGTLCTLGIRGDTGRRARAVAAFRTGRFAFAVPTILFMIVTTALWSGVVVTGSGKLKAFDAVPVEAVKAGLSSRWPFRAFIPPIDAVQKWLDEAGASGASTNQASGKTETPECSDPCKIQPPRPVVTDWSDYLRGLLLVSVTPGLFITMAVFLLSLLLLVWAVLPSIVFEKFPEWTEEAKPGRIRKLGAWLSRGLDNIAILTRLLWFAIVPVPLFFFAVDLLVLHGKGGDWQQWVYGASKLTLPLITISGFAVAVAGATVFGLILKYLTTVLDAILDVDNYLRTGPKEQTPRARIAERCVSLLRYIAAYKDTEGRAYSKVIIVAHSLGSMVTTDLLRYLERSAGDSEDSGLARYAFLNKLVADGKSKLPIYVFSMGSPLRQLLNRFFPHLYWWVSDVPDNSLAAVGGPIGPAMPSIDVPSLPRPDEMNVYLWTNAYRSGDYIGRSLWVGQWLDRNQAGDARQPPDVADARPGQRSVETCIGLGAHTHYWDRSAPEVAAMLDRMIS